MGNQISQKSSNIAGKVILLNGTVQELVHATTVAELMLENPYQVVVEFGSSVAGKKLAPLPAEVELDKKKTYIMLPINRGKKTSLSVDEAHRILLKANTVLRSKELLTSTRILPLFARICTTSIKVERSVFVQRKDVESRDENSQLEALIEDFDERPRFLNRQFSGKMWKPSLDTIKEMTDDKFSRRWF